MSKQMEFDFPEVGRSVAELYEKPAVEYFKRAFEYEPAPQAKAHKTNEPILSTDSAERKNTPIFRGVIKYFPLAVAAVARHSQRSNDKHNPGEPLHWAREKSTDHQDCMARHLVDSDYLNPETNEFEEACALAWRALAHLQLLEERRLGKKS